jgi:hypothetical protein
MPETEGNNGVNVEKGLLEGFIEALADKHSQLDVNFQSVSIKIPGMRLGVELNGLITVSVHMRELTDEEKKSSAARNVAIMSKTM